MPVDPMRNPTLSCLYMASNYANSYLVPISFWMLTRPWIFYPISFCRRVSRFVVLQTKVAHLCFCLVRIKNAVAHMWAIPPVRLGLSGRNSGNFPERPRKRSQSVSCKSSREYGWDPPKPYNSRHLRLPGHFQNYLPQYGWGRLFFQNWFWRGLSELLMEFPAVLRAFLSQAPEARGDEISRLQPQES